jgi:sulfur relay (sulfurtransferase) complex TusBCD TusD component (DsrE family)
MPRSKETVLRLKPFEIVTVRGQHVNVCMMCMDRREVFVARFKARHILSVFESFYGDQLGSL